METTQGAKGSPPAYIRELRRVTWIGLTGNVLLSAFKIVAGLLGHSQAVFADGIHSLSDTSTDVALLIGVRYWVAPPDSHHPHGHSRIETVVTAIVGITLVLVALGIGYNSLVTMKEQHTQAPGPIALIAALTSILIKELLYRWNILVGKRLKSPALIANAWHHRSDGLSSVPVAIAVGAATWFPGWYFLDHIGACLVSAFILAAAWKILRPAFVQLTDGGASPAEIRLIENICRSTDGVLHTHKCRTRRLGNGLQVDIHIQVKPSITVREGHAISSVVKQELLGRGPDVVDVITHLEPFEESKKEG